MRSSSPLSMSSADTRSEHRTQLSGTWLILARIVCVALFGFCLTVFFAELPGSFTQLHVVCESSDCVLWQLTPTSVLALRQVGLTVESYAIFSIALSIFFVLVWSTIGAIIAWRKSNDWMALLVAILLVTAGVSGQIFFDLNYLSTLLVASSSPWFVPTTVISCLGCFLFLPTFLLFPDGRFVPRWTSWLLVVGIVLTGGEGLLLLLRPPFFQWLTLFYLGFLVVMAPGLFAQLYRYRSVSTPMQRQQTKWVVLGTIVELLVLFGGYLPLFLFPSPTGLYFLIVRPVAILVLLFAPLCLAIAILRYRLWDIDILVNRTLVYGTLTISLALIYIGLVIGLGLLVGLFTGQFAQSPVVIVASTLAIAALFGPLCRRIQQLIDRRFYRSKYDAQKTLDAFSSTLQEEVDLEQLCERLLTVVQETMQPAFLSLWVRPSKQRAPGDGWVESEKDFLYRMGGQDKKN
jgi:hypothetical protein